MHDYGPEEYPDAGLEDGPANYCRNPGTSVGTIWCYTTDPEIRWGTCCPLGGENCGEEVGPDSGATDLCDMNYM